jgi:hypothetical protein
MNHLCFQSSSISLTVAKWYFVRVLGRCWISLVTFREGYVCCIVKSILLRFGNFRFLKYAPCILSQTVCTPRSPLYVWFLRGWCSSLPGGQGGTSATCVLHRFNQAMIPIDKNPLMYSPILLCLFYLPHYITERGGRVTSTPSEVPASHLVPVTGYPDWHSRDFHQSLRTYFVVVP